MNEQDKGPDEWVSEMSAVEYREYLALRQQINTPEGVRRATEAHWLYKPKDADPTDSASYQAQAKNNRPKGEPEHDMQCQIVSDFARDYPDYVGLLFAIPNGAKLPYKTIERKGVKIRVAPEAQKLLAEGLLPGVCDLFLSVARGGYHGLYLELKIKPNKPTSEQIEFMARATDQGYHCEVIYTRQQGAGVLSDYLSL